MNAKTDFKAIAAIPRVLLERLDVVPLGVGGHVNVICMWDPDDHPRVIAAELELSAHFPSITGYTFIQSLQPDRHDWMRDTLDHIYERRSVVSQGSESCSFCGRTSETSRLFCGKLASICAPCAASLRGRAFTDTDVCNLCDFGSRASGIISSNGYTICSGCLGLVDHILSSSEK